MITFKVHFIPKKKCNLTDGILQVLVVKSLFHCHTDHWAHPYLNKTLVLCMFLL